MAELLSIGETAAYLNVPVDTLRKWRSQGTGPRCAKLGKHLRYRQAEVDRWIHEREQDGRRAAG
jgi:excisionase family DNA binding protein